MVQSVIIALSPSHTSGEIPLKKCHSEFCHENDILRQDRNLESMETFSIEIKMRLSQKVDAMMSMMHRQINRPISSATSERVIPEIQNNMSSMSSGNRDTASTSSVNNQEKRQMGNRFKTKKYKERV